MPTRRIPVEAVLTAVVTTLKGTTAVTGITTGGIYNNVPQNTPYPYIEVSLPSVRRQDTYGRPGGDSVVQVKVVSQAMGDQEAARISDQCVRALDFQRPSASGHSVLGMAYEDCELYRDVVNGIVTRYHANLFRVWTEQSST